MSYTHFTLDERKYLQKLLSEGLSFRKIAAILDRSPSTICREVNRNKAKYKPHNKPDNKYWYNHWRAQTLYICRRREQYRAAIQPDTPQWNFIVSSLKKFWSPEEICGRWSILFPEEKTLSVSTVYRYIKLGKFPDISAKKHLRRRGKRMLTRKANYNSIQPEHLITERPEQIEKRERIGDWEGDTVYGGPGKGLLVSMVDRKSRFLKIGLLKRRTASETRTVIEKMMRGLPVHSISLDNGSEFAQFRTLEKNLSATVYFAEPHKPWQRGTNENMNDVIRFFYPKGCDFRNVTVEDILYIEDLINNRPRKCLGWKTPAEVFFY